MKIIQKFDSLKIQINENGFMLVGLACFRKIVNFLYSYIVLGNSQLRIDYTSKIEGLRNIEVHGKIHAGKHFWLGTYNRYGSQRMNPKIVFKGDFAASDFCHIGATNYIEFGKNVLLGSKVYITDHQHGSYSGEVQSSPLEPPGERNLTTDKSVIIGDNVWIGDNVVVLPGVTIGSGCVIGANAVVTKDIAGNSIAVGIPAKVIRKYKGNEQSWCKVEGK